ncbi:hypothetical protein LEP1GSC194_0191 [Leptospira alstonii serovar Sichuan str. 79601]|uniref:Uncharacterized protein n=1 Tax=Leptospira alstonii serovar Sichuan str. 79601 TaxID=1218565 RepID=M6CUL6_9LEPT|nr:hypothetical protein LEP1GSC194_0191 [Leptospira alstonii serovar Sichuan str. 79601]
MASSASRGAPGPQTSRSLFRYANIVYFNVMHSLKTKRSYDNGKYKKTKV